MRRLHACGDDAELVHARHSHEPYWPALEAATGSVLMVGTDPLPRASAKLFEAGRSYTGTDLASMVFEWMSAQPCQWSLWGRIAILFGDAALRPIVVDAAELHAALAAREAKEAAQEERDRLKRHNKIDLLILDPRGARPGLSLRSGDEAKSFFVMRFSEKWERERVLDWLRWQKESFVSFRDFHETGGSVALERLIIAGMRETESYMKAQGRSSGGRRPLRFWRGEP